jgi:hypothetical protein
MGMYKEISNEFTKHLFQHRLQAKNIKINILHFMFGNQAPLWMNSNDTDKYYFINYSVYPKTIARRPSRYRRSYRRRF